MAPLPRPDDEGELAAGRDLARPGGLGQLGQVPRADRLVELRQLAADGGRAIATARRRQVRQRRRDPAGRLVEDGRPLVGRDPGQPLAALPPGARQEALERPARRRRRRWPRPRPGPPMRPGSARPARPRRPRRARGPRPGR